MTIEVTKREKMELPDGREVECLVLHPVIDTKGMFSKRSDTRIWLTDDARRLPVQIRSKFPFGTITLRLKEMVAAARDGRLGPLGVTYREADLSRAHHRPRRRAAQQGRSLAPRLAARRRPLLRRLPRQPARRARRAGPARGHRRRGRRRPGPAAAWSCWSAGT